MPSNEDSTNKIREKLRQQFREFADTARKSLSVELPAANNSKSENQQSEEPPQKKEKIGDKEQAALEYLRQMFDSITHAVTDCIKFNEGSQVKKVLNAILHNNNRAAILEQLQNDIARGAVSLKLIDRFELLIETVIYPPSSVYKGVFSDFSSQEILALVKEYITEQLSRIPNENANSEEHDMKVFQILMETSDIKKVLPSLSDIWIRTSSSVLKELILSIFETQDTFANLSSHSLSISNKKRPRESLDNNKISENDCVEKDSRSDDKLNSSQNSFSLFHDFPQDAAGQESILNFLLQKQQPLDFIPHLQELRRRTTIDSIKETVDDVLSLRKEANLCKNTPGHK